MAEEEQTEDAAGDFGPLIKGRAVNRTGLAETLGCSLITVDRHVRSGMPFTRRGSKQTQWEFDTAQCIRWLVDRARGSKDVDRARGMEDAKLREKLAMAEMREVTVAEKRGTLVHVEAVQRAVETDYAVVKSKLTSLPGRVAGKVADPDAAKLVERVAREEVNQLLVELTAEDVVLEAQLAGEA